MNQRWFVLCISKNQEKKVIAHLAKKGIEHFCPYTYQDRKIVSRLQKNYVPLFPGQLFIYVEEAILPFIKKIKGVINPMYWRSKPAVISREEINAIKMMSENYHSIQMERIEVNDIEKVKVIEKSISGFSNQVMSIRHHGLTVLLPNLGIKLTAVREGETTVQPTINKSPERKLERRFNPLAIFGL